MAVLSQNFSPGFPPKVAGVLLRVDEDRLTPRAPLIVFVGHISEIGPNLSYAQPNHFVLVAGQARAPCRSADRSHDLDHYRRDVGCHLRALIGAGLRSFSKLR